MTSQLYIPKRIKVGYQKRTDTYTGRLAYVIYWDDTGKLRKETSWESWRSKGIAAEEFDNVPTEGFVFHKDVKRYNWSHFSSRRTLIRVWDPRGIEFEITTENLIGILTCSDVSKRGLVGSFVYAWAGPELVLLPTSSEEYQHASTYTALQSQKVLAKTLVVGAAYKTKKEQDVVYLGRLPWHDWKTLKQPGERTYYSPHQRFAKPSHIFMPVAKKGKDDYSFKQWIVKSDTSFLGAPLTEQPVEDLAARIEAFQKDTHSGAIVKWEVEPVEVSTALNEGTPPYGSESLKRSCYWSIDGDVLTRWQLSRHCEWGGYPKRTYQFRHYSLQAQEQLSIAKQTTIVPPSDGSYYSRRYPSRSLQEPQLQGRGLGDLYITFDNGRRTKVTEQNYFSLTSL